jgi:photosystem II stability/assembly factor-like uncharacterized protein
MKIQTYSVYIIFILFENLSAQAPVTDGWLWQYPKPQGNTLNDVFVFDSLKSIAVGDAGTIIKTSDGGVSWKVYHHVCNITNNLSHVFFVDDERGWAVGGGLLATSDGGEHWSVIKTDSIYELTAVYFVNPDTGWVVGGGGIVLKTMNGGKSWVGKNLYEWGDSPDFGAPTLGGIHFVDAQHGAIVGNGFYGNSIYTTTDGGETWVQQLGIRPIAYGTKDVQFINKDTGWVVGLFDCILKTVDGGATWTYQRSGNADNINSINFTDAYNGVAIGNTVGSGGRGGIILITSDGGTTWTSHNDEIENALYAVDGAKLTSWAVGREGAIYKTIDQGEHWNAQREKMYAIRSIHFQNEHIGWAVGDNGVILGTANGGNDWQLQEKNDSISFAAVYGFNEHHALAVGATVKGPWKGIIMQTIDGGVHWTRQTIDTLAGITSVCFVNDTLGWIAIADGKVLRTKNKGYDWELIATGLGTIVSHIQFINDNIGWASYARGNILLKTFDGGKSWKSTLIDSGARISSFYFTNENKGWIVGEYNNGKNIYKTTDGGDTWTVFSKNFINNYETVYFANDRVGWAVGGYGIMDIHKSSIIKTVDGGETWVEQISPMINQTAPSYSNLYFLDDNTGWVVGAGIFKTSNGGSVVSVIEKQEILKPTSRQIELDQNYPNPFNPGTVIKYQILVSNRVSIKVYDLLGREVLTLVNENKTPGSYTVYCDALHLSSGIYVYVLQSGEYNVVKKMVVLH